MVAKCNFKKNQMNCARAINFTSDSAGVQKVYGSMKAVEFHPVIVGCRALISGIPTIDGHMVIPSRSR